MIVHYESSLKSVALEFGKRMHEESRYKDLIFSDEKVLGLLEHPNTYCAYSKVNGVITGFFIGFIQELWFSRTKIGLDLALYILPK